MADRIRHLKDFKVCRFCLDDVGPFTNIYEKDSRDGKQQIPLPLQIMACVAIEVFSSDGMPQLICNPCRSQTIGAYNFKTTCKKADDTLKLYLATGNRKLVKPLQKKRASSKNTTILEHIVDQSQTLSITSREQTLTTLNATTISIRSLSESNPPHKRPKLTPTIQSMHPDDEHPDTETIHITVETDPLENAEEILPTAPTDEFKVSGGDGGDVCGGNDSDRIRDGNASDREDYSMDEGDTEEEEVAVREGRLYEEYVDEEDRGNRPRSQTQSIPTNVYPCTICDRSFPLVQQLDLHMQSHDRIKSFSCGHGGCGRMFFNKYDLAKHTRTHLEYKPFNCIVCEKSFSREALLHRHEKVHANVPKYFCTFCDHAFLNRDDFDSHVEKHNKRRPFQCRMCNKSFVFKQGLQRHEIIHADEKPHKCNYCEASFTSPIKLMRHITSHAGLRPYPCKLCGRTFLLSHHLTRHLKSHYTGVGPGTDTIGQHKCDVCSMSFRRKDSLINHSAIHSMVNLKCVICNTAFETANQVKHHITSHLSGLPYPCDMCDYSFDTQDQLEEHELKHAEMEYEEQIEAEVSKEALDDLEEDEEENEVSQERKIYKMSPVRQEEEEDEAEDEGDDDVEEMAEFTITENGLVPVQRLKHRKHRTSSTNQSFNAHEMSTHVEKQERSDIVEQTSPSAIHQVAITNVVLPPLVPARARNDTKHEERTDADVAPRHGTEEQQAIDNIEDKHVVDGDDDDDVLLDDKRNVEDAIRALQKKGDVQVGTEKLKDIVRSEGTKVYARKAPVQRFKPQMVAPPAATMAPLSQINQSTLDTLGLTQQDVNSMPTKKYMDMKVGDKTVRVQKLIMTKAEIAAMAKEGKIEMKGGNLILKKTTKGPLTPIKPSDSTSKPSRISLENILDQNPRTVKQRIVTKRTYVKRPMVTVPPSLTTSITNINKELTITPIVPTITIDDNDDSKHHINLSTSPDLAPVQSIEEVNL